MVSIYSVEGCLNEYFFRVLSSAGGLSEIGNRSNLQNLPFYVNPVEIYHLRKDFLQVLAISRKSKNHRLQKVDFCQIQMHFMYTK